MKHILKFGKDFDLHQPLRVNEALGIPDNITNVAVELLDRLAEEIPDKLNLDSSREYKIEGPFKIGDVVFLQTRINLNLIERKWRNVIFVNPKHQKGIQFLSADAVKNSTTYIEKNVFKFNRIKLNLIVDGETTGEELRILLKDKKNDLFDKVVHELKHTYDFAKDPKTHSIRIFKEFAKKKAEDSIFQKYLQHREGENLLIRGKDHKEQDPVALFFYYLYYTSKSENLARIPEFYAHILKDEVQKKNFREYVEKNEIIANLKEMRDFNFEKFHGYIVNKFKKNPDYCFEKLKLINYNLKKKESSNRDFQFTHNHGLNDKQIGELVDKFLASIFEEVKEESLSKFSDLIHYFAKFSNDRIQYPQEKDLEGFQNEIQKLSKGNWRNFYEEGIRKIKKQADETLRKIYKLYSLTK